MNFKDAPLRRKVQEDGKNWAMPDQGQGFRRETCVQFPVRLSCLLSAQLPPPHLFRMQFCRTQCSSKQDKKKKEKKLSGPVWVYVGVPLTSGQEK